MPPAPPAKSGLALGRLNVDLLPHVICPEVRVRIVNPGVPAKIMEDAVTRPLEEQPCA